jgi:hypothetical protein
MENHKNTPRITKLNSGNKMGIASDRHTDRQAAELYIHKSDIP